MHKIATIAVCLLVSAVAFSMFTQVIPNPGHDLTGCSFPRDPDRGCTQPQDWTDCADCCRGGATCCACCPDVPTRYRDRCEAACEDTHGRRCDDEA